MKIPNLTKDPSGETFLLQTALSCLGFDIIADNWRGPKTERALTQFQSSINSDNNDWQTVIASSFAYPEDVIAFNKCKAQGKSDMSCFAVGDNGIGKWGANTAQTAVAMCALPWEIWENAGKSGNSRVLVRYNGIVVSGLLADTMPRLANIKNGAGIDLNPAFSKKLGLNPPYMISGVEWRWG